MIMNNLNEDCGYKIFILHHLMFLKQLLALPSPVGSAPKKILIFGFTLGVLGIWHAMMLRTALVQLENNARDLVYEQAMAYITANVPAGFYPPKYLNNQIYA